MQCPQCGQYLNDNAQFCYNCGNRMEFNNQARSPKKKIGLVPVLLIAGVLLIAVGVAALLLPIGGSKKSSNAGNWDLPPNAVSNSSGEERGGEVDESGAETVGIPPLDISTEQRMIVLEAYRELLAAETDAISYGLLDMLGDDAPELIVRYEDESGTGYYQLFFVLEDEALQAQGDLLAANPGDILLGQDGNLLIYRQDGYMMEAYIDLSMSVHGSGIYSPDSLSYTDTVLTSEADEDGLLELVLLGSSHDAFYSGWVRVNGRDYYYANKKPVRSQWLESNTTLYYMGRYGYMTHFTNQEELEDVVDTYCEGFMDAVNHKDVDYLKNSTPAHIRQVQKVIDENIYELYTFKDFTHKVTVAEKENGTGNLTLSVNVIWECDVEWDPENGEKMDRQLKIHLVYQDGEWFVDQTA